MYTLATKLFGLPSPNVVSKLGHVDHVKKNNVRVMVATPILEDTTITSQLCLCPLLAYLFCNEWFKINF